MTIDRRSLFKSGLVAGAATVLSKGALAAPPLSTNNFGLEHSAVERANAWLETDSVKFQSNLANLKAIVGPTDICAVVKADCYGNGLSLLLPSLMKMGITCFGFANNDEARISRAAGFKGRLIRLRTATLGEIEDALRYDAEELIGNLGLANAASVIAARHQRTLRYHFMLNSAGMSRNGLELSTDYGKADALNMLRVPHLRVVGICTHYPVNEISQIRANLAKFNEDVAWLLTAGKIDRNSVTLHTANSFATLNIPEARLDMVRPGRVLYGDGGPDFPQFQHIMTYKTRVCSINHYPAGDTVAYDRTYLLKRESWLANIPIGYSDGFRRVFSHRNQPTEDANQPCMLIRGHRAPVVGAVTMNTVMVDVTDIKDEVELNDEVVVFGKQGNDEITQEYLTAIAQTNPPDLYNVWANSLPKTLRE